MTVDANKYGTLLAMNDQLTFQSSTGTLFTLLALIAHSVVHTSTVLDTNTHSLIELPCLVIIASNA